MHSGPERNAVLIAQFQYLAVFFDLTGKKCCSAHHRDLRSNDFDCLSLFECHGLLDHILKTTAAVQLLGAQTILTGISASVARTVVQLGLEITRMYTRSKLSEGIELALTIVGKKITSKQDRVEGEGA